MIDKISNWIKGKLNRHNEKANPSDLRLITALHEAAHVVCAYLSKFHYLIGNVCLTSDLTGETFVTLSKSKLIVEGKAEMPGIENDCDVAIDAAIIFYAGFEAEKVYSHKSGISPDKSHSMNDYNYVDQLIVD
ncbi:hypothetical protein [Niastella populi]|uniref:Peptidase M41 domain-containing protein n=1 Tax=Niastella populi TaxID=550983 RepID=A0A1V9F542_9BACT|nr:hypothetical protein [Niastella populi]OQP53498.1 hypothetical protein A4R26_05795 [Niastella populi]